MKKLISLFEEKGLEFYLNEPLKKHANYRVGGPADVLIFPKSVDEVKIIVGEVSSTPFKLTVIGKGSNILISDDGIRGIVLKLDRMEEKLDLGNGLFQLDSGCNMVPLAMYFAKKGYSGFEFASGIPGNIGGSVYMNAGAHGSDMCKIITEVTSITKHGEIKVRSIDKLLFKYRWSMFHENDEIILSCKIKLNESEVELVKNKVKMFKTVRTTKQPYDLPSCGSVFKNPENLFAGELIELSGLKGYKHGGAQVSTKHANFIVNTGDATASDIYELIQIVKREVYKNFEIQLQSECRLINF